MRINAEDVIAKYWLAREQAYAVWTSMETLPSWYAFLIEFFEDIYEEPYHLCCTNGKTGREEL